MAEKCWICKRSERQIESFFRDRGKIPCTDTCELIKIEPEEDWDGVDFTIPLCGVCCAFLNGFVDRRVEVIQDCDEDFVEDVRDALMEIIKDTFIKKD